MLSQIQQKVHYTPATKISGHKPAFKGELANNQQNATASNQVVLPRNFTAAELAGMIQTMNSNGAQATKAAVKPEPQQFTQVSAKHILVDSSEEALTIKDAINSGKITFEDAAKQFSSCPSGKNGGDLGFFDRHSMVKPFSDAAFEANVNEVIGPVETKFGFHLIKVTDKK